MALKKKARMENALPESRYADGTIEKVFPSGNKVRFYPFEIKSADIPEHVRQSKFNPRRYEDLKLPAVQDILPSIQEAKRNTYHVYVIGTQDTFKVVVGLRRVFAVKQLPDAVLIGYRAAHLEEVDEQYLAQFSDVYVAPSFVDLGLTIRAEREFSTMTARQLGEVFGVSKDTANMAQRVAKLPKSILNIFPAYQYITFRFVKALSSLAVSEQQYQDVIESVKRHFADEMLSYMHNDVQKNYAKLSKNIENFILNELKPKTPKPENHWQARFKVKGVSTSLDTKGNLTLKFDSMVSDNTIEKVAELLHKEIN
ncbi:hypothetical protein A7985_22775 [Pseudoalteromonas luteoviolacea]|uniref:ParB/Sulfiredoxin domain-containing protein n=1 Tax=Pseudoalteromonas luteoviolacea TaxID=43657 RepID=A0A1C0TK68_9GAMM|nr:T-complex 10 C-terminal domain-containing protein [Pseudoalteromonas luteoviolacea]MBQ4813853.1 hypothetical protein [Pseudoalteromonas luteoviolacea]OCQ18843.1 hypothetical protein A7985_22775 [Pseudoalteromonas luteoviolacea]